MRRIQRTSFRTKPRLGAWLDRAHPMARGLRAFWLFNEGLGETARDLTASLPAVFTNSPTWTGGRFGGPAIQFGGTSYLQVSNPAAVDFTTGTGMTVVFAAQCDTIPSYVNRYIFRKGGEWQLDFYGPTGGGLRFLINGGGGAGGTVSESRAMVAGEYSIWAATYDRTSKVGNIYRDGALVATATLSAFGDIPTSSANLTIGSDAGTLPWLGLIDYLGLWDRVLNPSEILALASQPFAHLATADSFIPVFETTPLPTYWVDQTFALGAGTSLSEDTGGDKGHLWSKNAAVQVNDLVGVTTTGRVRAGGTAGEIIYLNSAVAELDDYVVIARLYVASVDSGFVGVVGRASLSVKTCYAAIYLVSSAAWQLYKIVAGTATQLGSNSAQTLDVGSSYDLELRCIGSTISLYVDGVSKISVTDSSLPAGTDTAKAGLYTSGVASDSTGLHFTSFKVGSVSAGSSALSIAASLALTAAATFDSVPPASTLQIAGAMALTAAATFDSVPPASTLQIAATLALTAAAIFDSQAPAGTLAVAATLSLTGAATFDSQAPAGTLAVAASLALTAAATFDAQAPATTVAINAGLALTAAASFSVTNPPSLVVNAGLALTAAASFSVTNPPSLVVNAGLALTAAASFSLTSPAFTSYASETEAVSGVSRLNGALMAACEGRIYLDEAPEGAILPYVTFMLVSRAYEKTTGQIETVDSIIQFSVHHRLPSLCKPIAALITQAFDGVPLAIGGSATGHCLLESELISKAEGKAPGGKDCWMHMLDFSILHSPDTGS